MKYEGVLGSVVCFLKLFTCISLFWMLVVQFGQPHHKRDNTKRVAELDKVTSGVSGLTLPRDLVHQIPDKPTPSCERVSGLMHPPPPQPQLHSFDINDIQPISHIHHHHTFRIGRFPLKPLEIYPFCIVFLNGFKPLHWRK